MAGRPKQGIDYAGWSVNIFDGDTKIDKLLDAQGWVGFSIYFYLCQMAYKFDGYFYRWCFDDSSTTARRMGGGLRAKTVEETVRYCLRIGLFDQRLFDEWNILTSKGIQRRYLAAIQGRRVKSIIDDYWLLEKNSEMGGLEKCASNDDLKAANSHLQGAYGHLQGANGTKVKESKVNTPPTPPTGGKPASLPKYKPEWFERFWALYPRHTARAAAVKAWDKLKPDLELCRVMANAIRAQIKSTQWLEGPEHIPHPSTWLNGARWQDEMPDKVSSGNLPEPEVRNGVR